MKELIDRHPKIFNISNTLKLLGLFLLLTVALWGSAHFNFEDIKFIIKQNQSQAILISLIVYILFGFTFLPSVPLTLLSAVLIGPLPAAVVAALGNTVAAIIGYQIGKTVGDVVAFDDIRKKLPFGLNKLPIESPVFLIGIRSIPAGTRAFNLVCGAYQVPISVYLWTTSLMFFISSIFLAYGGSKLINIL